jgi:hypothetical protein
MIVIGDLILILSLNYLSLLLFKINVEIMIDLICYLTAILFNLD